VLLVTEAESHGHCRLYWPEKDNSIEMYVLKRPVRCNMKQIVDFTMTNETETIFTVCILLCVTSKWQDKVSVNATNVVIQSINTQIE
jgi:hypothetical protein